MRLIDADALEAKIPYLWLDPTDIGMLLDLIGKAPTVDIGYTPYREESCEYKSHCDSYEHWHCKGCNACKEGGTENG